MAAVRAAVARRANRRIIMRQVGDRLIPVGVTSGRVHALPPEEGAAAEVQEGSSDRGSRRSRRRQQNQELNQFLGTMGLGGQDLEEVSAISTGFSPSDTDGPLLSKLMVMEAMRLSLIEHEAQQRRQEEEDAKKQKEAAAPATAGSTVLATAGAAAGSTATAASSQSTPNISTPTALRPSNVNAISRSATPTPSIPPASPSPAPSGPSSPPALGNDDQQSGSSPSPHQDVTDHAVTESLAPVAEPGLASASTALAQSRPRTPVSPASLPVITEPSSIGQDSGSTPSLPPIARVSSLSSSLAPSSYDVLPSTPDSTLSMSNIPLLDSTPLTPAAEGDSSSAPAS